jgi:hypothetical protein
MTLSPKGNYKLVIANHSAEWSSLEGTTFVKCGFNNPYFGTYVSGSLSSDIGVVGGSLLYKGTDREVIDVYNRVPNRLFAYDCDASDLQAIFLEGSAVYPYSRQPFPVLNPPPDYCDGSTKPYYINGAYSDNLSYASAGASLFPFRQQLGSWPTPLPCGTSVDAGMSFGFGYGSSTDIRKMRNLGLNVNGSNFQHWSVELTTPLATEFIYNTVESQATLGYIYNENLTSVTIIILKAPNLYQPTAMYKGTGYWEGLVKDNIAFLKAEFEEPLIRCNVDKEGVMPTTYHYVNYLAQAPSQYLDFITYDTMEGYLPGGDGQPHYYTVGYKSLAAYIPGTYDLDMVFIEVKEIRPLSEITVHKYAYPHEYYFKCTISS